MGLPEISKAKSKKSLLKPLPVKNIMKRFMELLKDELYGREPTKDYIDDLGMVYTALYGLRKMFVDSFFGEWKYDLTIVHRWDDRRDLTIELVAMRVNTKMRISLNKTRMYGYDLDMEGPLSPKKLGERIYKFFKEANDAILEWDRISFSHKPIIGERPPFELITNEFQKYISEIYQEQYSEYRDMDFFRSYYEYETEREIQPVEFHFDVMDMIAYEPIPFGPYELHPEFMELGQDNYYGYFLMEYYIAAPNIKARFFVDEFELDKAQVYNYGEVIQYYTSMREDLNHSVVQWNRLLEGG